MTGWAARCAGLRLQLQTIDQDIVRMRTQAIAISHDALEAARENFSVAAGEIASNREKLVEAGLTVRHWVDRQREAGNAGRDLWREQRDHVELNRRADEAEAYVAAVFDLASAAVSEAAHAVLEASLARYDANVASLPEHHALPSDIASGQNSARPAT